MVADGGEELDGDSAQGIEEGFTIYPDPNLYEPLCCTGSRWQQHRLLSILLGSVQDNSVTISVPPGATLFLLSV